MTWQLERVSPVIGAILTTGDLREAKDEIIEAIRAAVHRHLVLFLPDQHLFDDDLLAFAKRLGDPIPHPTASFREEPQVATFEITLERPPRADIWHTDLPYLAEPPAYGLLSNIVAPKAGGDTIFASSYGAYEALSPAFQQFCERLRCAFSAGEELRAYARIHGGEDAVRLIDEHCGTRLQPLVIRNPYTNRRALYMSMSYLDQISGLTQEENDTFLRLLRQPYSDPNLQARWRWKMGDLCVWDQRAVNHRGLSDHFPEYPNRTMQSLFVGDGITIDELTVEA